MKRRLEWRVGLFVLIALLLLAGLLLQFSKGVHFFQPTYTILLQAQNVAGLRKGASVLISGVHVGTVSEIRLAPDGKGVTISLQIDRQYVIHKDARFAIETSGFLGDEYVGIHPKNTTEETFHNGDHAQAEAPLDFQEVARTASGFLLRIDETVKQVNEMVAQLRQLLLNEQTLTNVAVAASNLRRVSDEALTTFSELNAIVATNRPALMHSGSNLVAFSDQLTHLAKSLDHVVATNSAGLGIAVKNIESSSEVLKNLMGDVQAGKGLAGALVKNEQMAADVTAIAQNLSITSSNLNRLGLWGILWQHKPPKPKTQPPPEPLQSPKADH